MTKPYLSLAIICGDTGVGTLPKLLRSVLNRSTNTPMVDEIVICWNGKNEEAMTSALAQVQTRSLSIPLKVIPQTWPGRFDVARNESFKHCTGEWVIFLDSDDYVSDAGKPGPDDLPAIERCEQDYGIAPPPKDAPLPPSLKDWLRGLPWEVNCILAPYDYTIDANGYVVIRQKMKRIVRRSANFIWWSPEQSGVHEVLYPLGNVAEKAVETMGLLVRHYPEVSDVDRATRNREIVFEMSKIPTTSTLQTGRHQYDLANSYFTIGDHEKADTAIRAAISNAQSPLDTYVYRLARATLCTKRGNHEGALGEAFAAIGTLPELQDAYFVATESFYLLGKWDSVIQFYELGRSKKPTLLSKDQPLYHFVQPRVQAAMAWGNQGEPEKGLPWAQEALALYPLNALALEGVARLTEAIQRKKAVTAFLDLSEFAIEKGEVSLARTLLDVPVTSLRGVEGLPRYRALMERLTLFPATFREPKDVAGYVERASLTLVESAKLVEGKLEVVVKDPPHPKFDVGFYCPHALEFWWPRSLYDKGLGGSESSVAYLVRELFKLGVRVTTYTPHGEGPIREVRDGIIERDLGEFSPRLVAQHDVLVSCRAPWIARRADLPSSVPIWCWHQDNGYGNPWTWSPEVDTRLALNLHVSKWAMNKLLGECYGKTQQAADAFLRNHVVLGNGIVPECRDDWPDERPMHVVTASDPSRGLESLLDAWPHVRALQSNAELHVYCGFSVSMSLAQSTPGMPMFHKLRALEIRLRTLSANVATTGIIYHGWASQHAVLKGLKSARVYCYPGGPMPEGYGVALVQAQAAGCTVMAPHAGALREVLDQNGFTFWLTPPVHDDQPCTYEPEQLAGYIVERLKFWSPVRVENDRHLWSNVAKRFVQLLEEHCRRAPTP